MPDLTKFLLARITEDEEVAIHAQAHWEGPPEHWEVGRRGTLHDTLRRVGDHLTTTAAEIGSVVRAVDHLARWDPARVLAECEAKKEIIEHHLNWEQTLHHQGSDDYTEGEETMYRMAMQWVIRQMLQPHADHPDFDPSWRAE